MSGSATTDPIAVVVSRWVDRAKEQADLALQATVQDALAMVKSLTPVRTGYLRANWTVLLAGDVVPVDGGAGAQQVIASLRMGDRVVIANAVGYARRVEYGFVGTDSLGRHYHQEGRHMMQQTIVLMPQIAQQATARIVAEGAPTAP